jgi:hypothetical protein
MPRQKLVLAALLLLAGMAMATIDESFIHDDDGCVVETHCSACLLTLGSTGVVTPTFSLPPVFAAVEPVPLAAAPRHEQSLPDAFASRGPPLA